MMEEIAAELSTKMDAGLAVLLIVFTGIIMFFIGLMTPFIVIRIAKRFKLDLGNLFDEEENDGE